MSARVEGAQAGDWHILRDEIEAVAEWVDDLDALLFRVAGADLAARVRIRSEITEAASCLSRALATLPKVAP